MDLNVVFCVSDCLCMVPGSSVHIFLQFTLKFIYFLRVISNLGFDDDELCSLILIQRDWHIRVLDLKNTLFLKPKYHWGRQFFDSSVSLLIPVFTGRIDPKEEHLLMDVL